MDSKEFFQKLTPLLKKNFLALTLGITGVILLISGALSLLSQEKEDIVFETESINPSESAKISVDVSGAVLRPGLYTLTEGSRVHDALVSAGGLSESADREWIEKNLNLALKLRDGVKIYVPRESKQGFVQGANVVSGGDLINVNSASSRELESLPGIGPVTAGKIIDNRPYSSIDELSSKKVVSSKVLDQIKDKITAF
ncbi:MAG: uptake protein and related DNA-binding protein [Candidatus Levybacteria bacterium GW2011_GWA2_40_8]|nr:MAG: uptake protein and related DNA-binding protein [Candidatus Levybacteria bacterium GW2011_GWA2_40_8]